jgi:hypothetical protein
MLESDGDVQESEVDYLISHQPEEDYDVYFSAPTMVMSE